MSKKPANKGKFDPTKINITDTRVLRGHIEAPLDFHITKVNAHNYSLGFELGFHLESKEALAQILVKVNTESEPKAATEAQGEFLIAFVYHVQNLEELVVKEKSGLKIHGALGNALASITYSTTRGILMARFSGTALQNTILPVIDPNELLEMPINNTDE